MPTIAEIRQKYPQYQDLSDDQLARGLHSKFYSDMPFEDFSQRIGLAATKFDPMNDPPRLPGEAGYVDPATYRGPTAADRAGRYGGEYLSGIKTAATARPQGAQNIAGRIGDIPLIGPAFGLAETAATLGTGLVAPALAATRGAVRGEQPTNEDIGRFTYEPRTAQGRYALGLLNAAAKPLTDVAQKSGADVALPPLAGELQGLRAAPPRAPKAKPVEIPTTAQLKKVAGEMYDAGKEAGVIVKPEGYSATVNTVRKMAKEEGIDPTLHPKSTAVLRRLEQEEGKPLTLQEAETLRKIALDAEDDLNPVTREPTPDARLAGKIVDELDESIDELSTNAPARTQWGRAKRSQMLDKMIYRAEIRAGANYTQAGMEHALRKEFEKLALNERRMRGLSQEQRAAVVKVAKGGTIENALRNLGKFDPTAGGMAALVSLGTGTLASSATGNPLAMLLPVAGFAGRRAATKMTKRNVDKARESLVGRGLPESIPVAMRNAKQPGVLAQEPTLQRGVLGNVRSATDVVEDLRRLDAQLQRLAVDEPPDSPRVQAIEAEVARLQAELSALGSRGAAR